MGCCMEVVFIFTQIVHLGPGCPAFITFVFVRGRVPLTFLDVERFLSTLHPFPLTLLVFPHEAIFLLLFLLSQLTGLLHKLMLSCY